MSAMLTAPCLACPYRVDVPSGVWHPDEYAKLPMYDAPTAEQPVAPFMCHAAPAAYCHGWAVCHSSRGHENELLALRLRGVAEVPAAGVPLFGSGREAADHGLKDCRRPTRAAVRTTQKLLRKHKRLRAAAGRGA